MARRLSTDTADGVPLWGVVAGIDRSVPLTRINDLGLAEAMDVITLDGVVKPRPGLKESTRVVNYPTTANSQPAKLVTYRDRSTQVDTYLLFVWYTVGAPSDDIRDLKMYSGDGSSWTLAYDWGSGSGASSLDTPPQITQFGDEIIVLPGLGEAIRLPAGTTTWGKVTDAQSTTELKAPVNCRFLESSGSRVFFANGVPYGTTENRTIRCWWCDSGRPTYWSNGTGLPDRGSASYEDLRQGFFGSHEITALKMHSSMQLLAWKSWGIWSAEWRGEGVGWTFIPGTARVGTIASETLQQWRDQIIFFGTDCNIYAIGQGRSVVSLGTKLQRYIASIINVPYANRSVAFVCPINNIYTLAIPVEDEVFPRHLIHLNLDTGAWTEGRFADGYVVSSAYSFYPGYSELPAIYLTQYAQQGKVLEYTDSVGCKDDGNNFEPYIWSRVYDAAELYPEMGESVEIHKMALQGVDGQAYPQTRVGHNLYELANATPTVLEQQDMSLTDAPHYTSTRTDAKRLAQWGVKWEAGETDPLPLQGVMAWMLPRGQERGRG